MDLIFAISATQADPPKTFTKILEVVNEITERFFSDNIKYGVIVYGEDASLKIRLRDKYTDSQKLKEAIESIAPSYGKPALNKALVLAKNLFESDAARKDARKVRENIEHGCSRPC